MALSRFLAIIFLVFLAFGNKSQAVDLTPSSGPKIVTVDDFGAIGNGTDGTDAFRKAWNEACSSQGLVNFVVPLNTYLLKPIIFKGPCKSDGITAQILGNVIASSNMSEYGRYWIRFDRVQHLTVEGDGTLDGSGSVWWNMPCKVNHTQPCPRSPTAVTFDGCENLVVRNLRSLNPQTVHISIHDCNNVSVSGLTVTAPANSPNTDGINIRGTTNIVISDCLISTGDDCIAINDGSRNVRVSNIICGPGHGISIGSLGGGNSEAHVSDVVVDGARFSGASNGVRIKTWQGGSGNATAIQFMNIQMDNVQNPIIIDQYYFCKPPNCQEQNSTVQVIDVLYKNITGTSASQVGIHFNCSKSTKCRDIVLQDVNIRNQNGDNNVEALCQNVELSEVGVVTPNCLNNDGVTMSNNPDPIASIGQSSIVNGNIINVDDFGAKGNGEDDDTDAFKQAWKQVCSSIEDTFLVVPQKSYLLKRIKFPGPCKNNVTVQILGTLEASENRSNYPDGRWILFDRVNDFVVEGGGTIDGNGDLWWRNSCKWNKSLPCTQTAPKGLSFHGCQNFEVRNLTIKDSAQMQITIDNCVGVKAHNLTVTAPGNSPNTDGIHITHSQNVDISNCDIGTGDDCISIVSGTSHISATDIRCGPGHGISIGSLGGGNSEAHVSDVTVTRARFFESTNGVRIKTWQGGSGNVSNVMFKDIEMNNVKNPIFIDQNYCIQQTCTQQESAVQVINAVYQNIRGTSNTEVAIRLDCSASQRCEGIVLQDIDLQYNNGDDDHAQAVCNNVHFSNVTDVSPQCPN